jgi:hypothetical protein
VPQLLDAGEQRRQYRHLLLQCLDFGAILVGRRRNGEPRGSQDQAECARRDDDVSHRFSSSVSCL